jgi:hypothetical protein
MNGKAQLFVSSRDWRLEGGSLDGELARARFSGSGVFEGGAATNAGSPLLVPRALGAALLSLQSARIGAFVDAASALGGRTLPIPSFVPLDAQLDGEMSWSANDGAKAKLLIGSAEKGIVAQVNGSFAPDGSELDAGVHADLAPAAILRRVGVPPTAHPRDEDVVHLVLTAHGELLRPEVKATATAAELGFRLGGARFVPPVFLRALVADLFSRGDRVVLRASANARDVPVTLFFDADLSSGSALESARGTLRADGLEAAFLRDVLRAAGVRVRIPDDLRGAVDVTLSPSSEGPALLGSATLATPSSRLVLARASATTAEVCLSGLVAAHDLLATELFTGAVRPADGVVSVDLALERGEAGLSAEGTASSDRVALVVADRPDIPPYVLEDATVQVAIDRAAFRYEQLRARAHGGRLVAHGSIPFAGGDAPTAPRLHVTLEEGGAELAVALGRLGSRRVAEVELPRGLTGRGVLVLHAGSALTADIVLETPAGTALTLALRHEARGDLEGSTLRGAVAVEDLATCGVLGAKPPIASDGVITLDLVARRGGTVLGWAASSRMASTFDVAPVVITDASARVRADRAGIIWNELTGRLHGGTFTSAGLVGADGALHARVSLASVAAHELPAISGRAPSTLIRGRVSGSVAARWGPSARPMAVGRVVIDEAAFPALSLVGPKLARYGLRPPSEDAAGPVTARIAWADGRGGLEDVVVALRGATLRGAIFVASQELSGSAEVTLEEQYLRTSKVLTLPRVFTERLVVPIRIDGPMGSPRVHADVGASLGRFLKDNRVSSFVTSAVEEAQILLGRAPHWDSSPTEGETNAESDLDAELRAALEACSADWEEIAARQISAGAS